jgi:hypothetical protein
MLRALAQITRSSYRQVIAGLGFVIFFRILFFSLFFFLGSRFFFKRRDGFFSKAQFVDAGAFKRLRLSRVLARVGAGYLYTLSAASSYTIL